MQNEKYREGVALYKAKEYTKAAELLSEVVEQLAALLAELAASLEEQLARPAAATVSLACVLGCLGF